MLKSRLAEKTVEEKQKTKNKETKKEVFRLSGNFLKFWQDCLLCWITGLLYLLLCLFLRAYLSGFSSSLFPSHMLPSRVPHTPTQNQGTTLTDCYHADYPAVGYLVYLDWKLFGAETVTTLCLYSA